MTETVGDGIGARVADVRTRKGWSQRQLAERLEALRHGLDRSALGRIETGDRKASLDDLMAVAAALDVSPTVLLLPASDEEPVAIAPALEVTAGRARTWIRGQDPLPDQDPVFFRMTLDGDQWTPVRRQQVRALAGLMDAYEAAWDREDAKAARLAISAMEHELEQQRAEVNRLARQRKGA